MQLTTVIARLFDPDGNPATGSTIVANLTSVGVSDTDGLINLMRMTAVAGDDGIATLVLWPSIDGNTGAEYRVVARSPDGRKLLDELITVVESDEPVNLTDLLLLPPPSPKPYDEAAIAAILQNRVEAQQAAATATEKAEQTAADRIQTGLDVQSTAQDAQRAETAREESEALYGDLDAVSQARADSVAAAEQTAQDAQATAADAQATAADRVQTGQDAQATAADRAQTDADRQATSADAQATADDRIQTGQDRAATGQDAAATAADRTQTGEDRTAASASELAAQHWATTPRDTPVPEGDGTEFSAKHWAKVAEERTVNAIVFAGTWDASTGVYPDEPVGATYWLVTGAPDGETVGGVEFFNKDYLIWNPGDPGSWTQMDNTDAVSSVNGQRGSVELTAADVGADPAGSAAAAQQAAIDEIKQPGSLTADVIGDLPQTLVAWSKKGPTWNAADYGFSPGNTGSANGAAIEAAIAAANGGRVVVHADEHFESSHIQIVNQPMNLHFTGKGRAQRQGTTSPLLTHSFDFLDIQSATLSKQFNVIFQGSTTDKIDTATVSDPSAYERGDIVKVFSDDIDPDAAPSSPRRRGEYSVVAGKSGNMIYLAKPLRQFGTMVTNVRIAKMQKDAISILSGLKIQSSLDATSMLIYPRGIFGPMWQACFYEHGSICCNSTSCHSGEFYLQGEGMGDSTGSLGYMLNDNNGYNNRLIRPIGEYFRHLSTTNFNATDPDGDPANYGGTEIHTVIDGIALSCQGPAYDDHEGAVGSRYINCKAYGSIDNDATQRVAFNMRGRDAQIINGYCDSSFEHMVRIGDYSKGILTLENPQSEVALFDDSSTAPQDAFHILIRGGRSRAVGEDRGFGSNLSNHCYVSGHELEFEFNGQPSASVFRNRRAGQRLVVSDSIVKVKVSAPSDFARIINENTAADYLVIKNVDFFLDDSGGVFGDFIYGRNSASFISISGRVWGIEPSDFNGAFASGTLGSHVKYKLAFPETPATGQSNISDLSDYLDHM